MKISIQEVSGILTRPIEPPKPRKLSGREVAVRNEVAVLGVIRDYGHLRTSEIAFAVWPDARFRDQLAQRTLRRLLSHGEVLQRVNTLATRSWVLAYAGVARLELFGANARHGRDIVGVAGATFVHRTLASAFLIHQAAMDGQTAYGEYAIAHGRAPATRQALSERFAKLPDGLNLTELHMTIEPSPHAKLLVELPVERYKILSPTGRAPCIGDLLVLDQGFTGPDGLPMVLAYFPGLDDDDMYEAKVYESELE